MRLLNARPSSVSLRTLLPRARFVGGADITVQSCTSDPRQVRPGDLFVAVSDAEGDGHDSVFEAVERGASAVLAERLLPLSIPRCIVGDSRQAFGFVCQALAGDPSSQLRVAGITGSNGKTVTSELLGSILTVARQKSGVVSCLGADDGERTELLDDTNLAAPDAARWLSRMVGNRCSHAVLEVSSQSLAEQRLAGVAFDAAILTNVRRDHADDHGSLYNYRRLKSRLFEQLKPGGFVVLNADDPASQRFLDDLSQPVLTIGMRTPAEVTASVLERHAGEQTFLLHAGAETIPVCTRMIGDQHVYNCLAAAATALVWGIDLPTIVRGLERVESLPGRMERIECGQAFNVFVDAARTPDSLAACLRAARQVTRGRLICVYGAEGERNQERRPQLGRVVEKHANLEVITSDNPRCEEPLQIAHDILDGYHRPSRPLVRPDRQAAILWALEQARTGDTIVVAGKGGATTQEVGARRVAWDDRDIVRSWLYEHPEAGEAVSRPVAGGLKIFG